MSNYVMPNRDVEQHQLHKSSRDPLSKNIMRELRRIETNIQKQLDRHPSDFVYWTLDHTGATCCWNICGREVPPLPTLAHYELDRIGNP